MRHSRIAPKITLLILAQLLLLCLVERGTAQTLNRLDNRGTEFRIAFMPADGDGDFPSYVIAVSCEVPTTGTMVYEGTGKSVDMYIPGTNKPVLIALDTSLLLLPDPVSGPEVTRSTLTLRFRDEVTVQGINTMRWSSDAFLGLPVDVIGTSYVVLSYPNTVEPTPAGGILGVSDFPSEFAVVASADNTRVTVQPTVSINGRGDITPFVVELDAGEVFLGQAIASARGQLRAGDDCTGTAVTSDKPVCVFGGHQRTNIPWDTALGRDHLVEQLLPTNLWAAEFVATPHFQLPKNFLDSNLIRLIAVEEGTTVTINRLGPIAVPTDEAVEIPLRLPLHIRATGPIEVAQYQHSVADYTQLGRLNDSIGDPFMMLVAGQGQFDTSYSFESWESKEFSDHFVNVVIPTESISTLRIDGEVSDAPFEPVGGTEFSYARIGVSAGGHHVAAGAAFGLCAYGYGPFNSYGYPCGMVFESLSGVGTNPTEPEPGRLSLHPNPALGVVTVDVGPSNQPILRIEVYDLLGRLVLTRDEVTPSGRLNVDALAPGLYTVVAVTGQESFSGKLIRE